MTGSGIFQNYLVFITAKKCIKCFSVTTRIDSPKSNRIITKSDSNFGPNFFDHHVLPDINFIEHFLTNHNICTTEKVINVLFLTY